MFVCHASDDKERFVRPLATELLRLGLRVWFDEFALHPGDSLRESIDRGLRTSRTCVVVLSPRFFGRSWPEWELSGIVQRHLHANDSVLLPIWLEVSSSDVRNHSPALADLVAIRADSDIPRVATQLAAVIRPLPVPIVHDPEEIARRVVDLLIESLEPRHPAGSLRASLRIREDNVLVEVAASGFVGKALYDRIPIGESISGHSLQREETIVVQDIHQGLADRFAQQVLLPAPRVEAMIVTPLRGLTGDVFGVASIVSTVPDAFKDETDWERIRNTVSICALALERVLPRIRSARSA